MGEGFTIVQERDDVGLILGCDSGGWKREGGFQREESRITHMAIEIVS